MKFEVTESLLKDIFATLAVTWVICFIVGSLYLGITNHNKRITDLKMVELSRGVR